MKARQKGSKRNDETDGLYKIISELQSEIVKLKKTNDLYKKEINELKADKKNLEKEKQDFLKLIRQSAEQYKNNVNNKD